MPTFPLVGGPCGGQRSRDFAFRPPGGFTITCGDAAYVFEEDGRFHVGTAPSPPAPGAPLQTHQVERAWARWMRELGVGGARTIRHSHAARARLKRLVR